MTGTDRITLAEAKKITGLSISTIQRRVDAWLDRDEDKIASGYALKGGRAGRNRTVDRADTLRLARQLGGGERVRSGSTGPVVEHAG